MSKDILIIRMSKEWEEVSNETKDDVYITFQNKIKDEYILFIFYGENETNKTEFEIIRYEKSN